MLLKGQKSLKQQVFQVVFLKEIRSVEMTIPAAYRIVLDGLQPDSGSWRQAFTLFLFELPWIDG